MKRPVLPLLLGACVLWAALPTFAQSAADGLPTVGARWKYSFRDQQYRTPARVFAVEVTEVKGSLVQELLSVEGGDISLGTVDASSLRFLARPIGGASVVELAPYSSELYRKTARAPTDYPGGLNSTWTITAPAYGEEQVSVPGGMFSTLRVEVSGDAASFGASTFTMAQTPARFVYTAWYSPELRRYVRIRHRMWNRWNAPIGDELVQLVAYQPGR